MDDYLFGLRLAYREMELLWEEMGADEVAKLDAAIDRVLFADPEPEDAPCLDESYTTEEASILTGKKVGTIRGAIAEGRLSGFKHNGRLFIRKADLDVYR